MLLVVLFVRYIKETCRVEITKAQTKEIIFDYLSGNTEKHVLFYNH